MTETEKQDGMAKSEIADGMCDMDDLMAELSEDELAELTELEELEEFVEIALLEELEALEELDGVEEAWLDGGEEDEEEGQPQEGIPISDWLADSPDDGQGETSRTEETEQADEDEDPYDQIVDGYIYLITNLVNGKKYVGQTTQTVEKRWRGHLSTARCKGSRSYSPIDRAIAYYGEDAFSCLEIEHIHQQPRRILDQRETFWIDYYETYIPKYGHNKGYNIRPGGRSLASSLPYEREQEIVEFYQLHNNMSYQQMATYFDISRSLLQTVLLKNNIILRTSEEIDAIARQRLGFRITRIDLSSGEILQEYPSCYVAAQWVQENTSGSKQTLRYIVRVIRKASYLSTVAYGYLWDFPDISSNVKLEKIRKYAEQKEADLLRTRKRYERDKFADGKVCPICGVPITNESTMCPRHAGYTYRREGDTYIRVSSLKGIEVTEEEMRNLLRFHSISEIARMFDANFNVVKKFLKRHFDIVVDNTHRYRLWNNELQCYEFMKELPITKNEFEQLLETSNIIRYLATNFRVNERTMRRYLYMSFGEKYVRSCMSQVHKASQDITDGYIAKTLHDMGKHILIATNSELSENKIRVASKYLERHLLHKREDTVVYMNHTVQLLE